MYVRPAVPNDAESIVELNAAAWRAGFRGIVKESYLAELDDQVERRRVRLLNPAADNVQFVAVVDDVVAGWVWGAPASDDDCDPVTTYAVEACYTHPDYWRRGVGRAVMEHLLDCLDPATWRDVVLWTLRDTPQSRSFYESLGFFLDGSESTTDRQGPVPIVRYRFDLTP